MAPEQQQAGSSQDPLTTIDPAKRKFIKALVAGVGFATPMVASFSMKGVSTYVVHAQVASNIAVG